MSDSTNLVGVLNFFLLIMTISGAIVIALVFPDKDISDLNFFGEATFAVFIISIVCWLVTGAAYLTKERLEKERKEKEKKDGP
ncbi:hypothetical protein ACFL29_02185 [Patescibacteria group bacterium]